MKKLKLLLLPLLSIMTLTACEFEDAANVNQDRIFTYYELFYNANEDITYAKATLFFGNEQGTKLQSEKATITFNGEALDWNDTLAFYETKLPGYVAFGEFEYIDLDDNEFNNEVAITTADFPDDQPKTMDREKAYPIEWQGTALTEDETIAVAVVTNALQESKIFFETSQGADEIILGASQLKEITPEPASISIDRIHNINIQEVPSAGGKLEGKYRAKNLKVTIQQTLQHSAQHPQRR